MKFCVIMGSPMINGNTAELCKPFITELEKNNGEVSYITLTDKNISPCKGCYKCQDIGGEYGCIQHDDAYPIMDEIIAADCLVLATPIYSWYCTPPMKALIDRHYGLNKFYGRATGSLWEGKNIALITTHGYDADYGAGPFKTGIERLCKHSKLNFMGMYSVRDIDGMVDFKTDAAVEGAKQFARQLMKQSSEQMCKQTYESH